MYPVSRKDQWIGASQMRRIEIDNPCKTMPLTDQTEVILCEMDGYLYVCSNRQEIWDVQRLGKELSWYIGPNPIGLLAQAIFERQDDESGKINAACECESFDCTLTVKLSGAEFGEIKRMGALIIVDGCATGPNSTDVLVEQRKGYRLFRE